MGGDAAVLDYPFERGLVASEEPTEDDDDDDDDDEGKGRENGETQREDREQHNHSDEVPHEPEQFFALQSRRPRVRKRMKIVVDGDRDGPLDARLHPPVLSHDSPFSRQIKSAPPLPLASPMVWPKVGVKAAFRRLLGSPPTETRKLPRPEVVDIELDLGVDRHDEPDAEADDEEEQWHQTADGSVAAASGRRRPRVDSCSSCSSSSSSSTSSWTVSNQPMAT
ncbi:hypothetical protein PINS_up022453 [Pythium insidiosum]|nr:hypothetical protein PINS_up022453 [Pythium insidiosum]